MATISIIVPVYNVERYLHRCVDSILNQTFTDFELILVDDGSPDNCGGICKGQPGSCNPSEKRWCLCCQKCRTGAGFCKWMPVGRLCRQ